MLSQSSRGRRNVFYWRSICEICLHLLCYTLHCTPQQNIVLIRQYLLHIFQCFAAQVQILRTLCNFWKKRSMHHRRSFCFWPNIDKVVSQPVRAWKKGRALADITPKFDTILWTGIYFKSFPFPNSTHNSWNLSIWWYTDIVMTTALLSTVLTSILLFDRATFFAWRSMR